MSSFNGKPQATVGRIRRRLRLAVKRTAAKWGSYFVSDAIAMEVSGMAIDVLPAH
jgi:hypothetical protein